MNLIVILSAIPVIIWAFMAPFASRFADLNSITTSIGQILGLVGMVLFSINLILAGRIKLLDKYFKGLDKVYSHHSKLGALAFSMILFHPLFLVVKYLVISTREAALFFIPSSNIPVTFGIIALLIMIILMIFTFYIKLKYNIWKFSHKFMIVVFFFAIIHTFLITSDISRNDILKYYILSLALLGLIISIEQALLNKFVVSKYKYVVKSLNLLNKDILEVEMSPTEEKISFTSGQFSFFNFISDGVSSESHPFSISSSSISDTLKITVKNLGDYTSGLVNLKIGDKVLIDGPYGYFSYRNVKSKNQIWIAGGIGITPFYSMAQVLDSNYNIDFYYSVKDTDEAVYVKELQDIATKNSNFKFKLWSAKDSGYINGESIMNLSSGLVGKDIFLCGPSIFTKSLKDQFIKLGVDINNIHYEKFKL